MDMDGLSGVVANVGVVGSLIWFLYHTTSVTLPKIVKSHNETLKDITDKFLLNLEEERKLRKEEFGEMRRLVQSVECRFNKSEHLG